MKSIKNTSWSCPKGKCINDWPLDVCSLSEWRFISRRSNGTMNILLFCTEYKRDCDELMKEMR